MFCTILANSTSFTIPPEKSDRRGVVIAIQSVVAGHVLKHRLARTRSCVAEKIRERGESYMRIFYAILTAIALTASATVAAAAALCYESRPVKAGMVCTQNTSKSADFTSGCRWVDAHVEQVVVDCPPPPGGWAGAMWSDMSSVDTLRRKSCSAAGFSAPAAIGGQVCKSAATPYGGAYIYTYKYTSGNTQDKKHQLFFCYASASQAPASGRPGTTANKVTHYACAP
jgi:hypothetical protein